MFTSLLGVGSISLGTYPRTLTASPGLSGLIFTVMPQYSVGRPQNWCSVCPMQTYSKRGSTTSNPQKRNQGSANLLTEAKILTFVLNRYWLIFFFFLIIPPPRGSFLVEDRLEVMVKCKLQYCLVFFFCSVLLIR